MERKYNLKRCYTNQYNTHFESINLIQINDEQILHKYRSPNQIKNHPKY